MKNQLTSLELCAGGGGQALGLEMAGFDHIALFENDSHACQSLRINRSEWRVIEHDLFQHYDFEQFNPSYSPAGSRLLADVA